MTRMLRTSTLATLVFALAFLLAPAQPAAAAQCDWIPGPEISGCYNGLRVNFTVSAVDYWYYVRWDGGSYNSGNKKCWQASCTLTVTFPWYGPYRYFEVCTNYSRPTINWHECWIF